MRAQRSCFCKSGAADEEATQPLAASLQHCHQDSTQGTALTFNWPEDVLVRTALALQSSRFAAVKWHYCTVVFSAFRQIKACSKPKKPITAFAEALTQAIDLILFNVCHQISLSLSQYGTNFHLIPACLSKAKAD